jgi:hypothetical protein
MTGKIAPRASALFVFSAAIISLSACGRQAAEGQQEANGTGLGGAREGSAARATPSVSPIDPNGLNAAEEESIKRGLLDILKARTYGMVIIPGRFPCVQVFGYGEPQITDASLSDQVGMVQLVIPVTGIPVHNAPNVWPATYYPGRDCFRLQDTTEWSAESGQPVPLRFEVVVQRWQTGWRLARNQNPPALL